MWCWVDVHINATENPRKGQTQLWVLHATVTLNRRISRTRIDSQYIADRLYQEPRMRANTTNM